MPFATPPEDRKAFFYESFAEDWDAAMNQDEVRKRLRLLSGWLGDVRGAKALDAGAGTGLFSRALEERGARVTALELGPRLLAKVREKCGAALVTGDLLSLPFPDRAFELVLCTEALEHTLDPARATAELCRVTAPGGRLLITAPNRVWKPVVYVANALKIRPYEGYENWVGYRELSGWVRAAGLAVERQAGFNLLPHTRFCRPAFDILDRWPALHPFMLNIILLARRPARREIGP